MCTLFKIKIEKLCTWNRQNRVHFLKFKYIEYTKFCTFFVKKFMLNVQNLKKKKIVYLKYTELYTLFETLCRSMYKILYILCT